jgi:hypothetical protein
MMGRSVIRKSLFDPLHRVLGVEGLRVVDASVMPTISIAKYLSSNEDDCRARGGKMKTAEALSHGISRLS